MNNQTFIEIKMYVYILFDVFSITHSMWWIQLKTNKDYDGFMK